jgi:hypothetical protein
MSIKPKRMTFEELHRIKSDLRPYPKSAFKEDRKLLGHIAALELEAEQVHKVNDELVLEIMKLKEEVAELRCVDGDLRLYSMGRRDEREKL